MLTVKNKEMTMLEQVTAIGKGEAYVYAYAASGAFAKITVTVQ